jgi:hypothetical protein
MGIILSRYFRNIFVKSAHLHRRGEFGYATKSQKLLCLGIFIGHYSLRAYEGIRTVGEGKIRVLGSGFLSTEVSVVEQRKE